MPPPTIYGIRHHGPGCARSLVTALEDQRPDLILLESPAEAEPLLSQAAAEGMKPPVSILIYQADNPEIAGFYPFARFSPEWQAILWALQNDVPVRCFDLPATHAFALRAQNAAPDPESRPEEGEQETQTEREAEPTSYAPDPFEWFARADGYSDGERWWNDRMEERAHSTDFFAAILEAVTALRSELAIEETPRTLLREAWMRRTMRQAAKDGFEQVAVICGAWHAPVLATQPKVSEDNALLKGLPKVKVAATWTPWTNSRLTTDSGYGAGVRSPGWYDHLWQRPKHATASWLTKAARILRKQDLEGSSASVIEAVRFSESLAGLRGRSRPGLDETLEAMRTIFCAGDETPLELLARPLLVGTEMGTLPEDTSTLPLQKDIEAQQRRLRLKPAASSQEVTLDLREDGGRNRSAFLHRLLALEIEWGEKKTARSKGTFKEIWKLHWRPELVLAIIDASRFGNTLETAAANRLVRTREGESLRELTERLDLALLSRLDDAAARLLTLLDQAAATANDTLDLLAAIPSLVRIARYGDVRETDTSAVTTILLHLTARAHIELPGAATGINDEAAADLSNSLRGYASALGTLDDAEISEDFHEALSKIAEREPAHAEPRGLSVRLLRDAGKLAPDQVATHFSFALSIGREPAESAAWLEGFLSGSGSLLVHDRALLALIDQWLATLSDETFQKTLPLLRRTFGSFTSPERQRIGQTVIQGNLGTPASTTSSDSLGLDLNPARAKPAVATVARLLDLPEPE